MSEDEIGARVAALAKASTGQVSDAMDRLGLPHGAAPGVLPLDRGHRVAGRAFTVLFGASSPSAPFDEYIDEPKPGDVLVLANQGRMDCAIWGGQRSLSAIARGIVGTFIDGACRDVDEHIAWGYPVFSRSCTPVRSRGIVMPVASGVPVGFGGIAIFPGDVVLGDATGTLVVPRAELARVVEMADAIRETEEQNEAELRAGRKLADLRSAQGRS